LRNFCPPNEVTAAVWSNLCDMAEFINSWELNTIVRSKPFCLHNGKDGNLMLGKDDPIRVTPYNLKYLSHDFMRDER
jgi:hypothetical protein